MKVVIFSSICLSKAWALSKDDFTVDRKRLGNVVPAFDRFDGTMYAGQMPISVKEEEYEDSKFMFWLFESENAVAAETLTFWFNGGPGCSSLHGGLYENAPVSTAHYPAGYPKTTKDPPLLYNEWAWTRATNMIYVEMPQGVGFSYGPMPDTELDIGKSFYGFLMNFYKVFPEMKSKQVFLLGESYAGYYVPSVAHKIHQENIKAKTKDGKVNLAGIGLGNGWIEATTQGPAVIDYAWWHGMIDSYTKDSLHQLWKDCTAGKKLSPPFHDFTVPDECSIMEGVLEAAGKGAFPENTFRSPNPYDVTTFDLYPVLFGRNTTMDNFYNNKDVKKALNAPLDVYWEGCIPGAGRRRRLKKKVKDESLPGAWLLAHDKPESMAPYIKELVDGGIRVLIYNGDRDLTTCAQGSEMVLNKMYDNNPDWLKAERGLWMTDGAVAGFSKEYGNLQFVVVYNAGHLLPNSNPQQALDLITRFVTDSPFLDISLPRFDRIIDTQPETREASVQKATIPHWLYIIGLALLSFGGGYLVAYKRLERKEYYTELA